MSAGGTDDIISAIGVIGAAIIVIAIIVAIVGALAPVTDGLIGDSHSWEPDAGTSETLSQANERPAGFDVAATTETAVRFNTEAAHAAAPITVPPNDWTVCTVAALDDNANQLATYDLVAIENETVTLRYDAGAWEARHGPSTTGVEVPADSPTELTPMCARWNGTHLSLDTPDYDDTAASGTDVSRNVSVGLVGELDEIRVINSSAPDATVQTYLDDPIHPLGEVEHTSRIMFDDGEGSTATLIYAAGSVDLVGDTSWVSGVPGPGLVEGVDYSVDASPLRVTPLAGGYLEDAPIAFATWGGTGFGALLDRLWSIGGTAFVVLVVGTLVIAAMAIHREFNSWG